MLATRYRVAGVASDAPTDRHRTRHHLPSRMTAMEALTLSD
jgi:hypothetical protein